MRTSSAKAKGRRLQQQVRDLILERFSELEPDDVQSLGMGQAGVDIQLSPAAKKKFPFSVECKNQESIAVWAALDQAEKNCKPGTTPALVFKRNNSKTYIAIELNQFMDLVAPKKIDNLTNPAE